jgi:Domain of unknown function (DUF4832)/Domain of unknown function (DUF4874)
MRNILYAVFTAMIFISCTGCLKGDHPAVYYAPTQDTITYTESNEDFPNPDRGFYRVAETSADDFQTMDSVKLRSWRTLQTADDGDYQVYSSLVFRNIILKGFTTQPLTESLLSLIDQDFAAARTAGVKIILRFTYTIDANAGACPEGFICPPYGDASKETVLGHIAQLKPLLQKNADVISCMQMGFVGTWGENYYSDYFGDPSSNGTGQLFDKNWIDKASVIAALLDALPADRMIQVRTPQQKQRYIYGPTAPVSISGMTDKEAYTKTDNARIGFHNDCFVSSPDDYGTYEDYGNSSSPRSISTGILRDYFMNDSKFTAVGGETCDDSYSPFNDCEPSGQVQTEMRNMHYSFLNCAYNNDVNNDWQTGGCMDAIKKNLGYRFVLKNLVHPADQGVRGMIYKFTLNLLNAGYATPFNEYPAKIVLRNSQTHTEYYIDAGTDIRTWYSGQLAVNISLLPDESIPAGSYDVLLNLGDKFKSLAGRPEYAIRLANDNTWEPSTGYNDLHFTLTLQ